MNHAVVGMGEVGTALADILATKYKVWTKDQEEKLKPEQPIHVLHICLNYHAMGAETFRKVVAGYLETLMPEYLDICSTVAPGTTEWFGKQYTVKACHSTTRGLHPNLQSGLRAIRKHVGGPRSEVLAAEFGRVGIRCVTHGSARSTELAHILNNSAYGISLMFADEMARLCRDYGVDYYEAVMKYTSTHNEGFRELDHERLVRPILTPPGGRIGGHCVTQGATLVPEAMRGPMMTMLARYNDAKAVIERPSAAAATARGAVEVADATVRSLRKDEAVLPVERCRADSGGEGTAQNDSGLGPC